MGVIEVPALSLWQPWAWLLVHGHEHANGKRIENRRWPLPESACGRWCLIHAAKRGATEKELLAARCVARAAGLPAPDLPWCNEQLMQTNAAGAVVAAFGGIVGAVKWGAPADCEAHYSSPWWAGPFGWPTLDAKVLPFVAWRGRQGLFGVPLSGLPAAYQWLGKEASDE
ncbi:MAG TPA: hypothetical protein VMY35_11275 [Phycisphaerae bacterium]|nr:hypothetical protein [Phycisphaerae bacterium]